MKNKKEKKRKLSDYIFLHPLAFSLMIISLIMFELSRGIIKLLAGLIVALSILWIGLRKLERETT